MNDVRQKTVLVAGATGYLGGHVCQALKQADHRVKALVRDPERLGAAGRFADEIFVGQATDDATLDGLCDGVDVVFSSIGLHGSISRKSSVWDVDYAANMNILRRAQAARVEQFIFISVINAPAMRETIQVAEARERVGDALRASGLTWTLLRPTGFFNDLEGFFEMIRRRGRAWFVGDGSPRSNPIHGADLARIVVQAIDDPRWYDGAFDVGGPDTYSMREIAESIFESLDRPAKITTVPPSLVRVLARMIQPFHGPGADFLRFFSYEMLHDGIGEPHGSHHIKAFFDALAHDRRARG